MKTAEIRSKFLKYFESKGHTVVESSSLVPSNDPTLLFTNAGMVQFKDVFLGKDPRPYVRATTSQKCVRAGGKHNDLENVGFTARHHTFFEMLGNFSFGDYFKKEAIKYAWEFVTKELNLPKDRLYVTVFEKDDEAAEIWHKQEGVPKDRIYRFGEKDNFWSMGDTGPCGPCSEIFIDRGQKYSCGKPTCGMGCDCDRYMEFWNLVFMQFDRDATGKLTPLPKPSVDTGAGLERIASILQDSDTNYDTDLFISIIQKTSELARLPYDKTKDTAVSFRVVADHSRAAAFLIGDGVLPSNEGRGYVLRRIMRRAVRHGKKLGFTTPFMNHTVGYVIDEMKVAYPDLIEKRAFIERVVLAEEEQFLRTLEKGLALLDDQVSMMGKGGTLSGETAFKLYDTYGFPLDLTRVILTEKGIGLDESGFERAMEAQRAESRKHWKGSGEEAISAIHQELAQKLKASSGLPKFVGYDRLEGKAKCVALIAPSDKGPILVDQYIASPSLAQSIDGEEPAVIEAVFAETPFYGESGGQTGDKGRVVSDDGFEADVIDVQKPVADLIVATLRPRKGTIKVGTQYLQQTDREIRAATARNHTATHLLHWALREVLGKHVKQAGSLVAPDLLRFDFNHFQAMTEDELARVEELINEKIWSERLVSKQEMKKDEAVSAGAIAFFGEKYGDLVRVIKVGTESVELCGGTHVDRASDIHLFKVANESGIAAGVRRIIGYTSRGAFQFLSTREGELKRLRTLLKTNSIEEVSGRVEKLVAAEREMKRELDQLQSRGTSIEADRLLAKARTTDAGRLIIETVESDAKGMIKLRDLTDHIKAKVQDAIVVLGMMDPAGDKAYIVAAYGTKANSKLKAGEVIQKAAPFINGKGGGKPDFAQAGGTNPGGLAAALDEVRKIFQE